MGTYGYYAELIKPSWAPPAWVFAPVWTVLYLLIAASFGYVFYLLFKRRISSAVVLPFALNLFFNFAFTPILFMGHSNFFAMIDVLLVLATLVWALATIRRTARWVVYTNIPYLAWVAFAAVLQITVTALNW